MKLNTFRFMTKNKFIWPAIILLYVVWGSTYLGIRFVVEEIPPFFASGLRNLLAGIIVFVGLFLINALKSLSTKSVLIAVISGFFMLFVGNGFITMAARWVPSGYIAIFPAIVPIWLVLFDLIFNKVKPTLYVTIGCIIGLLGVGFLVNQNQLSINGYEQYFFRGIVLVLLATIGWSIGVFMNVNIETEGSIYTKAGIQMISGGTMLMLMSFINVENGFTVFINASPKAIWAFSYLLIFGSVIGFLVFNWVSQKASPTLVSTYSYVNPIVAIFLGWLLAGETISGSIVLSCFLVLLAVFLISKSKR
jgi:drug/metabolite transporter (DMT)-like permease